jgi:asparaginyl-tRNA synthetase
MGRRVVPPESWKSPHEHLGRAIQSEWYQCLATLLAEINYATHEFCRQEGFCSAFLPVTTSAVSSPIGLGSDSLPVRIHLGEYSTYLADSMQFLLEYVLRIVGRGVYYIMPSFRGEPVDNRHLSQFFHSEMEIEGGLDDVMTLVQRYVRWLCRHLLENCPASVAATAGGVTHVERVADGENCFKRIRFDEAARMLDSVDGCVERTEFGFSVLTPMGERELVQRLGDFCWVSHMPHLSVPFYQACELSGNCALAADLLAGIGEVVGCGERMSNGDEVRRSLCRHGVSADGYSWYLEMKDRFPRQTAGFGLGVERFLLWLTATSDIRNCTLVLRDHRGHLAP